MSIFAFGVCVCHSGRDVQNSEGSTQIEIDML